MSSIVRFIPTSTAVSCSQHWLAIMLLITIANRMVGMRIGLKTCDA